MGRQQGAGKANVRLVENSVGTRGMFRVNVIPSRRSTEVAMIRCSRDVMFKGVQLAKLDHNRPHDHAPQHQHEKSEADVTTVAAQEGGHRRQDSCFRCSWHRPVAPAGPNRRCGRSHRGREGGDNARQDGVIHRPGAEVPERYFRAMPRAPSIGPWSL